MDGNPYAALAELTRGQGLETGEGGASAQAGLGAVSARMRLGQVVRVLPLTVRVAGVEQPPGALRVNERLVKGAKWKTKTTSPNSDYNGLTGPVSGPVQLPPGHGIGELIEFTGSQAHSPDTTIDEATVEQLELDLAVGDEVLLLTQDDQIFYIIMKVARAV